MCTFGATIVNHRSNYLSRKLISLINHNTTFTMLIQRNIRLGAKWQRVFRFAPGSGQNGQILYFLFSLYLKNIIIYDHISWLNTCIVIVSRFLPNSMIIGCIYLTWNQCFLSYAILSRLPLPTVGKNWIIYALHIINITRAYFEDANVFLNSRS